VATDRDVAHRGPASARPDHDVAIVGAGILGLATARELLDRRPGLRVAVLDKEDRVGFHQTGHNSGVVHAGIYYAPGSLKARLCVEGARRLYDFCDAHGVAYEKCGKVIVARDESELARLDELERRGRANAVPGLRRLDRAGLAEVEPHTVGVAALHSPATGIVDFPGVARALAREVEERGGRVLLGHEVTGARRQGDDVVLEVARAVGAATISAGNAIFCAGPWADRLAVKLGAPADPRIVPFRGAYLKLRPQARELVRGLVYPVPDPDLPFLGVHVTRHISGEVWLGPSALLVGARDAYRLRRVRARDVADTVRWPGTWRVMRRWWRTGLTEMHLAVSRRAFVEACRDYVPDLSVDDVAEESTAGVRAQAVGRDGRLVDDFLLGEHGGVLHVRNAPSPAATSSLALAGLIADRAQAVMPMLEKARSLHTNP
jgi:2-hydroxyglutarate dehydrogenase